MKRIPSLRTNRAEREGSGRQQQEPRRSVTYSRSIRPNESKRAGNGNARNRGENPFAGNALSFVLLLNHHERIGDDDDLSSRVHTMASRIKSVSQQSPAALMGEGGGRSKDRPAPVCFFFSFEIASRVLSSSVFHFRLLFVCVQSSSRHPPLLKSGEMYRRQKKRDFRYFRASIEKTRVGPFVRPDQVLITRWKLMGGGSPPPASIIDMMGLLQRHRMAGNSRL